MAYQEIHIQSNEASPWTTAQNNVSLTIPSYLSACDLSQSSIVMNIELLDKTNGNPIGLYDYRFRNNYMPRVMVKNCRLVSNVAGTLEEIQSSNVLTCNLQQLQQDFEDQTSNNWRGQNPSVGCFIRKVNLGSSSSTTDTDLHIPLQDIFGLGKMTQYPASKFGNTKIVLEFEDTVSKVASMFIPAADVVVAADDLVVGLTKTVLLTETAQAMTGSTFYVGQPVEIQQVINGSAVDVDTSIVSISADVNNKITLVLADDIGSATYVSTAMFVSSRVSSVADANITYRIKELQLNLYKVNLSSAQNDALGMKLKKGVNMPYTTFNLERVNMPNINANQVYNRQYEIEPQCPNVFVSIPDPADLDPFVGRLDNLKEYRYNLNGLDTTSRDILPFSALYYDRLLAWGANSSIGLKSLQLEIAADVGLFSKFIIPQTMPMTKNFQVLQLQFRQGAVNAVPNKILYLFKQVERELKLTSSGVQVV